MATPSSPPVPLAVIAAIAVGVAGVSLAAMSDDRHGSRALRRALQPNPIVLRYTEKTDSLLGNYDAQVFDTAGNRGPVFATTTTDAAAQSGMTVGAFRSAMSREGLVDVTVTAADLERIAENMGRGGHYFLIQLREAGILPPFPDFDMTELDRPALSREERAAKKAETAARKARYAAKRALSASRRGSSARVKPASLPLSPEAFRAMQAVQDDPAVTRARQALTLFRRRDTGYAEARMTALAMINDLVMEMAAEHGKGRRVSGAWLDKKLALKTYQRITMTDLFETWARLTAEKLDAAR